MNILNPVYEFDPKRPCLVLAPHLDYPIRNGSDILIDRKWSEFSRYVYCVDIVARNCVTRYWNGEIKERVSYENANISKGRAAISSLWHRSHYLLEKFITQEFLDIAQRYLSNPEYNLIIFSYIWTAAIVDRGPTYPDRLHCIETHNDEIMWFRELRKSSVNPMAKLVAYLSEKWLNAFLERHERDFLFLHVSKADQDGYLKYCPRHISYVTPVGVESTEANLRCPQRSERVRLIFAGSLGVKMNVEAIKTFRDEYYGVLKKLLADKLEVVIVGSNPSRSVRYICYELGWELHHDISDIEMENLYIGATFSLLPFRNVTGAKLKLLKSLAYGTPFLATFAILDHVDKLIYPCVASDDPQFWLGRILEVKEQGIPCDARAAMRSYAMQYSWQNIANRAYRLFVQELRDQAIEHFPSQ